MATTYINLLYHLVFSTKGRRPLIQPAICDELYAYMGGIVRAKGGVLLEIGGMPDHVHLVVKLPADLALAELLRVVKSNSSKWVNDRRGRGNPFAWQTGYPAFTVSESQLLRLRRYVQDQEAHHGRQSFQEELVALLERHGIEYDPRYL
jgi:REP element-mobilizing transposase RayT